MRNMGMWTAELAPWALSVMAAGGRAIVPIPPRGLHSDNLLPSNTLTIWAYTNMSDPRWTWGERFILLQQDSTATTPQKLGVDVKDNWAAYAHNGHLFLKMFERVDNAAYPDLGCTVEIFTNDYMLELETLGPLTQLEPGGEVEHIEDWFLYNDVQTPKSDNDVDTHVLPLVAKARQQLGDL